MKRLLLILMLVTLGLWVLGSTAAIAKPPAKKAGKGQSQDRIKRLEAKANALVKDIRRESQAAIDKFRNSLKQAGRIELPPNAEEVKRGTGLYKMPVEGCPYGTIHVGTHRQDGNAREVSVTLGTRVEVDAIALSSEASAAVSKAKTITDSFAIELKDGCLVLDRETRMSNDARQAWNTLWADLAPVRDKAAALELVNDEIKKLRQASSK